MHGAPIAITCWLGLPATLRGGCCRRRGGWRRRRGRRCRGGSGCRNRRRRWGGSGRARWDRCRRRGRNEDRGRLRGRLGSRGGRGRRQRHRGHRSSALPVQRGRLVRAWGGCGRARRRPRLRGGEERLREHQQRERAVHGEQAPPLAALGSRNPSLDLTKYCLGSHALPPLLPSRCPAMLWVSFDRLPPGAARKHGGREESSS